MNKEFHLISSLLQFGRVESEMFSFQAATAKAVAALARKLYSDRDNY